MLTYNNGLIVGAAAMLAIMAVTGAPLVGMGIMPLRSLLGGLAGAAVVMAGILWWTRSR